MALAHRADPKDPAAMAGLMDLAAQVEPAAMGRVAPRDPADPVAMAGPMDLAEPVGPVAMDPVGRVAPMAMPDRVGLVVPMDLVALGDKAGPRGPVGLMRMIRLGLGLTSIVTPPTLTAGS
jgi:hypothetical protein